MTDATDGVVLYAQLAADIAIADTSSDHFLNAWNEMRVLEGATSALIPALVHVPLMRAFA